MSFLKSCRCWALESHYTVLLSPGVDILSNLNYFPVSRDRNLTKKLQKNSNAALFPVATTPPPPSKKPLHLNIDTCITRNPAVSHHFSQYSTERQKRKHTLSGLSLRARGRGFSPATKRVAPGYFYWKIEEK